MKRAHPEDDLQRTVVEYLRIQENLGRLTYFSIPNGEKRDKITGAKLKRLGVRAGVYDLAIIGPHGIGFIELKAPRGSFSIAQTQFGLRLDRFHIPREVCWSLEEVQGVIAAWVPETKRSAA